MAVAEYLRGPGELDIEWDCPQEPPQMEWTEWIGEGEPTTGIE